MQPQSGHPAGDHTRLSRILCLDRLAGQQIWPGYDTASSPVSRYLAQPRAILFLFDPTQDPWFYRPYRAKQSAAAPSAARFSRQDILLNEAMVHIRG